jgi:predicted lipoprotein with Yx(FWY)xxD motif
MNAFRNDLHSTSPSMRTTPACLPISLLIPLSAFASTPPGKANGDMLVDSTGRTLYVFAKDTSNYSKSATPAPRRGRRLS